DELHEEEKQAGRSQVQGSGVGDRPGGHADSAAGEQGAQHRPGVVLGAAAGELDVDVLVGHGPHSIVSSSFAGPATILMASFGTGATVGRGSPAVHADDNADRR